MLTSVAKFAVLGNDWCACKICMGIDYVKFLKIF